MEGVVEGDQAFCLFICEDCGEDGFEKTGFQGILVDQGEMDIAKSERLQDGFAGYNQVKDYFVYGLGVGGDILVEQDLFWGDGYCEVESRAYQFVEEGP